MKKDSSNLLRVAAMIQILLFHAVGRYGFTSKPSILHEYVIIGGVGCTVFFCLSGYALRNRYVELDISEKKQVEGFLLARITSLYPTYFVILLALNLYSVLMYGNTIWNIIKTLPVQITLMQANFSNLVGLPGNNNFWFISCLYVFYLLFPYINELIRREWRRSTLALLLIIMILGSEYIYVLLIKYGFDFYFYYMFPLFRLPECVCGMVIADLKTKNKNEKANAFLNSLVQVLIILLSAYIIHVMFQKICAAYNLYNIIILPAITGILLWDEDSILTKISESKPVKWLVGIGLNLYLCQSITDEIMRNPYWDWKNGKTYIILTFIIAITVTYLVTRPSKCFLRKRINKLLN